MKKTLLILSLVFVGSAARAAAVMQPGGAKPAVNYQVQSTHMFPPVARAPSPAPDDSEVASLLAGIDREHDRTWQNLVEKSFYQRSEMPLKPFHAVAVRKFKNNLATILSLTYIYSKTPGSDASAKRLRTDILLKINEIFVRTIRMVKSEGREASPQFPYDDTNIPSVAALDAFSKTLTEFSAFIAIKDSEYRATVSENAQELIDALESRYIPVLNKDFDREDIKVAKEHISQMDKALKPVRQSIVAKIMGHFSSLRRSQKAAPICLELFAQ